MKRLRYTICGFVPIVLAALALGVPTAAPDLGLQSVNLSCNDGTNLNLALDTTALTALTNAVTAINLYPAGDPALSCGLSQSTASSTADPNGPHDFVVGGGQFFSSTCGLVNFAISAHVSNNATVAPGQPGVGGTYQQSVGAMSTCGGEGNGTAKVDCLQVSGNMAQFTATFTHSKGNTFFGIPGAEVAMAVVDNTPDTLTPEGGFFTSGACDFSSASDFQTPITRGNINVHDAP